ncbi:MAG: PT domain-containing protein [Bdellovibrionota bacterium]
MRINKCWHYSCTNQPTNQPTSQPTNQPANQPTNQSTNQPTNLKKSFLSFFLILSFSFIFYSDALAQSRGSAYSAPSYNLYPSYMKSASNYVKNAKSVGAVSPVKSIGTVPSYMRDSQSYAKSTPSANKSQATIKSKAVSYSKASNYVKNAKSVGAVSPVKSIGTVPSYMRDSQSYAKSTPSANKSQATIKSKAVSYSKASNYVKNAKSVGAVSSVKSIGTVPSYMRDSQSYAKSTPSANKSQATIKSKAVSYSKASNNVKNDSDNTKKDYLKDAIDALSDEDVAMFLESDFGDYQATSECCVNNGGCGEDICITHMGVSRCIKFTDEKDNKQECCGEGYELVVGYDACKQQVEEGNENSCDVSAFGNLTSEEKSNVSCCVKKERDCFCEVKKHACESDADCCGGVCMTSYEINKQFGEKFCSLPMCTFGAPCKSFRDCEGRECVNGKCSNIIHVMPQGGDKDSNNYKASNSNDIKITDCKVASAIDLDGKKAPKYVQDCADKCHICFYEDNNPKDFKVYQCRDKHCKNNENYIKQYEYMREYVRRKCYDSKYWDRLPCTDLHDGRTQLGFATISLVHAAAVRMINSIETDEGGSIIQRCEYNKNGECVNRWKSSCSHPEGYLNTDVGYSELVDLKKFQILKKISKRKFNKDKKKYCKILSEAVAPTKVGLDGCEKFTYKEFKLRLRAYSNLVISYVSDNVKEYVKNYKEKNPQCKTLSLEFRAHSGNFNGKKLPELVMDCSSGTCSICNVKDGGCSGFGGIEDVMDYMEKPDQETNETLCEKMQKLLRESGQSEIVLEAHAIMGIAYHEVPSYKIIVSENGCRLEKPSCEYWVAYEFCSEKLKKPISCIDNNNKEKNFIVKLLVTIIWTH